MRMIIIDVRTVLYIKKRMRYKMSLLPTYRCKVCSHTFTGGKENVVCSNCGSHKIEVVSETSFAVTKLKKRREN